MTAAHGVNVTTSRSKRQALTAQHASKISARSAALAVAAALKWSTVIAIIAVV
jgi:hypothetical protein